MTNNRKKFCFIICVNDDRYLSECQLYINRLKVPDGYTVEVIPVLKAKSMAEGYNRGMALTDAKYKIYLHQDVFIINPNFLNDILTIFNISRKIGMIGVIGSPKLSPSAVMSFDKRIGNLYSLDSENVNFEGYEYGKNDGLYEVEAIEGLLMVTRFDIPWREDIFDGWEYYDVAQSFEFTQKGYKVVVPGQRRPWCIHDNDISSPWFYNKYRKIFIEEYMNNSDDK